MEELKQTVNKVLGKLLGERLQKVEMIEKIESFFKSKGIKPEEFEVDVKKKYIYIRVDNPYIRQEMSLMSFELIEYLRKECEIIKMYEIKFTGRM